METLDLFSASLPENNTAENNELVNYSPLAARMRPRNFGEYVGQEQILGKGKRRTGADTRQGKISAPHD